MTNHARAHFLRASAAAQAADGPAEANASQYELMLYKLAEDKRRLSDLQSQEKKAALKATLLPDYLPWLDGVLQGNTGRQDDVVTTCMVWAIDCGDLPLALRLGRYVMAHKLAMPDKFKRSAGCVLAEEFADTAIKAALAGNGVSFDQAATLDEVQIVTAAEDMPDEVRAKLHKAQGYVARALAEAGKAADGSTGLDAEQTLHYFTVAKTHLTRALELHSGSGVKKDLERLEVKIKQLQPNSAGAESTG